MRSRILSSLIIGALSCALAGACATRFQPPGAAEPHATLVLPALSPPTAGMVVEPAEINGLPRPQHWSDAGLRVPPGELALRVRAAVENQHGICLLRFPAVAGETYRLDARAADEVFTIRALLDGQALAQCEAPRMLSPTPQGVPGVIPRNTFKSGGSIRPLPQ
jgi:hypothetical protein